MVSKQSHKTNADRIRSMTDEELAEFFFVITDEDKGWLGWLKQEVDG